MWTNNCHKDDGQEMIEKGEKRVSLTSKIPCWEYATRLAALLGFTMSMVITRKVTDKSVRFFNKEGQRVKNRDQMSQTTKVINRISQN